MKKTIFFILLFAGFLRLQAQELPVYNHYFIYPNLYNPAYLGLSEYSEVTLLHRQQWVGIDGAPVFSNLGLQMPLSNQMAVGLNLGNNERGLLTTTTANGSFAYTLPINDRTFLSFGVAFGAGRQSIDVAQINDLSDPAIAGALDKSFFLTGQAGLMLQLKKLNIGFSLPNLFENEVFSDSDFQNIGLDVLNSTVSSARYNFELSPYLDFEPSILFISNKTVDSQFKGAGTFYIKDLVWIGGIYGEESGATVFGGLNVNDFLKIGYSYDLNPPQVSGFSNGTHEFYLKFRFGKRKVSRATGSTEDIIAQNTPENTDLENLTEDPEEEVINDTEQVDEPEKKKTKKRRKKDRVKEDKSTEDNTTKTSEVASEADGPKIDNTESSNTKENAVKDDSAIKGNKQDEVKTKEEKPVTSDSKVLDNRNTDNDREKDERDRNKSEEIKLDMPITEDIAKGETDSSEKEADKERENSEIEKTHNVVTVSQGNGTSELGKGYYVVVGAFKSKENANNYQQQLANSNYPTKIGFNSETELNYVYVTSSEAIENVIDIKDNYRLKQEFQFEDTWILRIE